MSYFTPTLCSLFLSKNETNKPRPLVVSSTKLIYRIIHRAAATTTAVKLYFRNPLGKAPLGFQLATSKKKTEERTEQKVTMDLVSSSSSFYQEKAIRIFLICWSAVYRCRIRINRLIRYERRPLCLRPGLLDLITLKWIVRAARDERCNQGDAVACNISWDIIKRKMKRKRRRRRWIGWPEEPVARTSFNQLFLYSWREGSARAFLAGKTSMTKTERNERLWWRWRRRRSVKEQIDSLQVLCWS